MKTSSKGVNRYHTNEHSLLHLSVIPWYEERYAAVVKEGNPKRIAKYVGMDPLKFIIEQPLAFRRSQNYYHVSIAARYNGLAFPDPKITFLTFDSFLKTIDSNKSFYGKEGISSSLTLDELKEIVNTTETFPSSPEYALTKLADSNNYVLLVFVDALVVDIEDAIATLFAGYGIEEIKGTSLEEGDSDYPKKEQETISGYCVGSIAAKDVLFKEENINIDIININVIKNILENREHYHNGNYRYDGTFSYAG